MRRILAVLLVVVLALVALIFLITQGGEVAGIIQRGQGIISLILALLQLVGIALALGLVVYVLFQYAQYIRPNRFIFEGFSNASKLTDAEKLPLDLNILARENLIHQFKVLDNEWGNLSGDTSSDADALLTDGEFFGQTSQKLDYNKYIPAEFTKDSHVLEDLKEVITSVKDSEGINLMALAEEIAPKEVTPIMKFVEAVVPPHIIRATGYLQWQTVKPDRAGITFEFVDQGSQRNLMIRTIWWKSKEEEKHEKKSDIQSSARISLDDMISANQESSNQKKATTSDDEELSLATHCYIDLLDPGMYWLALMFWKQRMLSNTPLLNYIRISHEKRRQAQLLYLFGAMFYACTEQFIEYRDFFCQLAIEHFRQASIVDKKWCLPYLYLADLYSFKMETAEQTDSKLLEKAIDLYDKAYQCAKSTKRDIYTLQRITIAKALAELVSNVDARIRAAIKEVENSKKVVDPASFDPSRADCTTYLYNLALWHVYVARRYPAYVLEYGLEATQNARRYVAYCLARSQDLRFEDLWNMISNDELFLHTCGEEGLNILKAALEAKRKEGVRLAELRDEDFKQAINDVLREVTKRVKGWAVVGN